MPYIRANGIRIAYDSFGDRSKAPLFLLHGKAGSRLTMADMAQALADQRCVIVYDSRGHGQTDKPEAYTLADHAHDLLALIDAFGYEKADLCGVSMGAYIAAQTAVFDPGRVEHLILGLARASDDGSGSSIAGILKKKGLSPSDLTPEQLQEIMNAALWAPSTTQARRDEITAEQLKWTSHPDAVVLTPKQTAAVNAALAGFDLRPGLKNITCPTLVISARYDGINPPERGQEIANLIPGSKMVILENSGHMAVLEEPANFVKAIRDFLAY